MWSCPGLSVCISLSAAKPFSIYSGVCVDALRYTIIHLYIYNFIHFQPHLVPGLLGTRGNIYGFIHCYYFVFFVITLSLCIIYRPILFYWAHWFDRAYWFHPVGRSDKVCFLPLVPLTQYWHSTDNVLTLTDHLTTSINTSMIEKRTGEPVPGLTDVIMIHSWC